MIGLNIGITAQQRRGFTPASLFSDGEEGSWALPSVGEYSPTFAFQDGGEGSLAILEVDQ